MINGRAADAVHFFRRGIAWTPWGGGTWAVTGGTGVTLQLCSKLQLTFDSASEPSSFTYTGGKDGIGGGALDRRYAAAVAESAGGGARSDHPTVARLLGEGPWLFGDAPISGGTGPLAFLRGGVLSTPSGVGSYSPVAGSDDLAVTMGDGSKYLLTVAGVIGCYQFKARRERDGRPMRGWVPMRHVSMEYTGWRDPWGCKM